jgi:Methylase involved in ubiquinone/menaquinone biosynthesis
VESEFTSAAAAQLDCGSGPEYGNWVSTRFVVVPAIAAAVLVVLAVGLHVVGPHGVVLHWLDGVALAAAVLVALVAAYFAYARHLLAVGNGAVQARVQGLVLDHLPWDGQGEALDIGCGNGPLTVALAGRFPQAVVTGVDFWGESWEYSQSVCETNAACEGVAERVSFVKASAAALPFVDGGFAAVVSNLCFHEVRDARDKREVLREALRVLEPGGAFAFQDLFRSKGAYGEIDDLLAAVRSWGVGQVEFLDTGRAEFIPQALRLPFMVGSMGLLYGRK